MLKIAAEQIGTDVCKEKMSTHKNDFIMGTHTQ